MHSGITALLLLAVNFGATAQPREAWSHETSAPLLQAPLIGEYTQNTGLEIMYTTDDPAQVTCLSARGEIVWQSALPENTSILAPPAATLMLPRRDALVAVGGEKDIACFYAESGELAWRDKRGPVSPGGVMWLDLDGDLEEELVVATQEHGVLVFTKDGKELWRFAALDLGHEMSVAAAMAGGDVNNDKLAEVLLALDSSIVALDGFGIMIWEAPLKQQLAGAPVIADCDDNLMTEVYALTQNPSGILSLDGDLGTERWFIETEKDGLHFAVGQSDLLVADLDQDGQREIVVGSTEGAILVLRHDGTEMWRATLSEGKPVFLGAADLEGDLRIEVLGASADGTFGVLDPWGKTRYEKNYSTELVCGPLIADLSSNSSTDLLLVEKPGRIRCLQSDALNIPSQMFWPMARQNAARTGFAHNLSPWKTNETENLLINGDFEHALSSEVDAGAAPYAWNLKQGEASISGEMVRSGEKALNLISKSGTAQVQSAPMLLSAGLESVNGGVLGQGGDSSRVFLQWLDIGGETLREDAFQASDPKEGWTRYSLASTEPPEMAYSLVFNIETIGTPDEKTSWDSAILEGRFSQAPVVEILYNQLGYETYAPKKFVVRSNWKAKSAKYAIVNLQGEPLESGELTWGIKFKGGGDVEWPGYYWRGEFSELYEKSLIRIGVELDGVQVFTPVIELGWHAVWDRVAPQALRALSLALCTQDGIAAWRTEMDGGTGQTPELFWELAQINRVCHWRFAKFDADKDGEEDLQQMLKQVGNAVAGAVQENGVLDAGLVQKICGGDSEVNATGGETLLGAMGLARLAMQLGDGNEEYAAAAEKALAWIQENDGENPLLFNLAVDLFVATQNEKYRVLANELVSVTQFDDVLENFANDVPDTARAGDSMESIITYETQLSGESLSFLMAVEAGKVADEIVRQAKNPFGVFMYAGGDTLSCFVADEGQGAGAKHTRHILEAASFVAQVYRYQPKAEYYAFVMDQINWLMGCNPFGVCLFSEMGKRMPPKYIYPKGMDPTVTMRGFLPGGPVAMGPGDDRPRFSLEPNTHEADLYNTVVLLGVLAHTKRMPVGTDDK